MHNLPDTATHAWRDLDGEVIFLDLAGDRYFRLPDDQNAGVVTRMTSGNLTRWHLPDDLSLPEEWKEPSGAWRADDHPAFSLPDIARTLWMQRRIERRLLTDGFGVVMRSTRRLLDQAAGRRVADTDVVITRFVRAFDQARLLKTAANRCLPRSIAFALVLAGHGVRGTVVIGVKRSPFGAHCWVQAGPVVLNDTWDEVQRFTPLLVL
jgi:Transglutaminase-like superfamily